MIPTQKLSLRAALRLLLANYDIPLDRRDTSNDTNLRWLRRNLLINNPYDEYTELSLSYIGRILSGEEWA